MIIFDGFFIYNNFAYLFNYREKKYDIVMWVWALETATWI